MTRLRVIDRSGNEHSVAADGAARMSVMEIIRDSGVEDILAICGGCCSCSTCHVYVDAAYLAGLPSMSADEADLLDGSEHRADNSRLACQLRFSDQLDGLRVTVAPGD